MSQEKKRKKVVVGMSGGVDSSVAACLLKEQGYEVMGVNMQLWQSREEEASKEKEGIPEGSAVSDAELVAGILDIPFYMLDFRKDFRERVITYFMNEYLQGRTPNPCIVCNRSIKWELLLKKSMELGADYVATGHYARIERLPEGRWAVRNAVSAARDQTYALYQLTQFQLEHTLMPLGRYSKDEVRRIAAERHLPVADKPDSQEICFIPDHDYAGFIKRETLCPVPPPGNFVTPEGAVLGRHKGIIHYTVGQRKGLGLAMGHPVFVMQIRPDTNEVVISEGGDVFFDSLRCHRLHFMGMADMQGKRKVMAKIRYAHKGAVCTIERIGEDEILCHFAEPVRAVTPGQAVVFYEDGYVLGGGMIKD